MKSHKTLSQNQRLQEQSRKQEVGRCVTVYSCENERLAKGRRRGGGNLNFICSPSGLHINRYVGLFTPCCPSLIIFDEYCE